MPFEALIFPGYLRVITKEIPKCKRLEFVVSNSHYEMHMMCVWRLYIAAALSPPLSDWAKRKLFLPSATTRNARSAALLSISSRPSSQ
jgi:hypothetical protein